MKRKSAMCTHGSSGVTSAANVPDIPKKYSGSTVQSRSGTRVCARAAGEEDGRDRRGRDHQQGELVLGPESREGGGRGRGAHGLPPVQVESPTPGALSIRNEPESITRRTACV